ncbi:MAG: hypothetical protein Tsb002_26850 [Wenzhouxiangellaceae bacterium]
MASSSNQADERPLPSHRDRNLSTESVDGVYVMTATGDNSPFGPEALFGVLEFDGEGNFSGDLENNTGPSLGAREVETFSTSGTVEVTARGMGNLTISGVPGLETASLIVTDTRILGRRIIATKLSFTLQQASASGNTITGQLTRRQFSAPLPPEALTGNYGFVNKGLGGLTTGTAIGDVNWDHETSIVAGDFVFSAVDPTGQPVVVEFFSAGPFTPSGDADGTGTTFSNTTGGSSHYVVTEVTRIRGRVVAKEIFFVPEFLDGVGNFSPALMRRRPDPDISPFDWNY